MIKVDHPADEPILISALQHCLFCPRQFAIIHVDQFWKENFFTADGRRLHKRVDLPGQHRSKGTKVEYALPLVSERYGLSGKADAVEFSAEGEVIPIEYKRGKGKPDNCDKVQLCAQALCLEEMLGRPVSLGGLFYFETRERIVVPLDSSLRQETVQVIDLCKSILNGTKNFPPAERFSHCRGCSLAEYCMPTAEKKSASDFLAKSVQECENY